MVGRSSHHAGLQATSSKLQLLAEGQPPLLIRQQMQQRLRRLLIPLNKKAFRLPSIASSANLAIVETEWCSVVGLKTLHYTSQH